MSAKSFLAFANKSLLNIRNLLEQNETTLNPNTTFPLNNRRRQRIRNYIEYEESDRSTLFGIPLIFVILLSILFITIVACIAIAVYCWCETRKSKENNPEPNAEEKEEEDKNIEMSQMKKEYDCGHINIDSLN